MNRNYAFRPLSSRQDHIALRRSMDGDLSRTFPELLVFSAFKNKQIKSISFNGDMIGFLFTDAMNYFDQTEWQDALFVNIGIYPEFRRQGHYRAILNQLADKRYLDLNYLLAINKRQTYLIRTLKNLAYKKVDEVTLFCLYQPVSDHRMLSDKQKEKLIKEYGKIGGKMLIELEEIDGVPWKKAKEFLESMGML